MARKPLTRRLKSLKEHFSPFPFFLMLIVSASLSTGCIKRNAPSTIMQRYTFEYPSPDFSELVKTGQTIKIERFSVAKAFNSQAIVFRPEPFQLDTYASDRWMVNPGDLVNDYLLRDLRNSGLFKAVFSFRDLEDARYVLEGSVDEFLEVDNENNRSAVITLSLTLLDFSRTGLADRLLFQQKYHAVEPYTDKSAAGLTKAMSAGMEKLSSLIIRDITRKINLP